MKPTDPLYGLSVKPQTRPFELSQRNIETTARYLACEGKHVFSGKAVYRVMPRSRGEDVRVEVCDRCGVPIPPQRVTDKPNTWSINTWWKTDREDDAA